MKIKLLGVLAIAIAISASAFTTVNNSHKKTNYYWFKITGSVLPGAAVPKTNATLINQGSAPSGDQGCSGASYQCVSGFTSGQVNAAGTQLKDNSETPAQQPYMHN